MKNDDRELKIMDVIARMEKATADEENAYLVVLASVTLAGHIINCCVAGEQKKADIRHAIKVLRYTANMDITAAQRKFLLQTIPTMGSA